MVQLVKLGRLAYKPALEAQHKYAQKLVRNRREKRTAEEDNRPRGFLLAVEHDPVYTVGLRDRRGYGGDADRLRNLGADYIETNRGGLITFHGPGQLVVYPVLDLALFAGESGCKQSNKAGKVMGMR